MFRTRRQRARLSARLRQRYPSHATGSSPCDSVFSIRPVDPLPGLLAGKDQPGTETLAGENTLNRMELGDGTRDRYTKITFWRNAIEELLLNYFWKHVKGCQSRSCWISTQRIRPF